MIKGGLCGLILSILIAYSALAKTATMRSGEHEAFTRLVIMFSETPKWSIDQTDEQVLVHLSDAPWKFDLTRAFNRIPQSRVKDIRPLGDLSGIQIDTVGNVIVSSFAVGSEGVAIDISNAPPPAEHAPPPTMASNLPILPPTLDKASVSPFASIDPRVSQAEQQLLLQLGRAAAQGAIRQTDLKPQTFRTLPNSPFGINTYTVMDDVPGALSMPSVAPSCAPDEDFDVASWVEDIPFPAQLSRARSSLFKELDQPNLIDVNQLAKTYLGFGMTTEARNVLQAFAQPSTPQIQTLRAMADILDNRPTLDAAHFAQMTGCNGLVALWAVMAQSTLSHDNDVNIPAVLSNYSALPAALRDALQQPLIDRMLSIDARDAASAVKNALARGNEQNTNNADLSKARLALFSGATELAAQSSAPLATGSDMTAVYALALQIKALVAQNQAVPRTVTLNAADLARSLGTSHDAYLMRQAHAVGLGSVGEFNAAFDILDHWPTETEPNLRRQSEATLLDQLSHVPDDMLFLTTALPRQKQIMQSDIGLTKQITISERLSTLGFGAAGEAVLSQATLQDERGKRALAKALLARDDAAGAITILDGIEGPAADALRAQALAGIGEHGAAAALFSALGDQTQAAKEAWRSGSTDAIREFGTETQKAAIESPPPPDADGNVLTRASFTLELSRKERETAEKLLNEIPAN